MDDNKPYLVVFPYITLNVPLEIRAEVLFPSTFLTLEPEIISEEDHHWSDKERKESLNRLKLYLHNRLGFDQEFFDTANKMLVEIKEYFYWNTSETVDNVIWCFLPASANQKRRHQFKTHLEEIRKILGYLWCTPDTRPQFFSLYGNYEQVDYYSFVPENTIWDGGIRCIRFSPPQPRKAGKTKYLRRYTYSLNQIWMGNIIEGCRIYPSSRNVFRRLGGDDLPMILETLDRKQIKSNIDLLFKDGNLSSSKVERIFDAMEWFNRSCYANITADVSLMYLAIAFETLLFSPRNGSNHDKSPKTQILYNAIQLIVGDILRLDEWVENFYNARSRIIHEGKWSQLRFIPNDQKNPSSKAANEHGDLVHYGWLIFRICIDSVLVGTSHSQRLDLEARFFTNQERLQQIHSILEQTTDSHDVMNAVIDDIRVLSNINMRDNHPLEIDLLLKIAILLVERLILIVDDEDKQNILNNIKTPIEQVIYDDETEIIEYTRLVFQNISPDELPLDKVIKPALNELNADKLPSLETIREHVTKILDRNNNLSDELQTRLQNVITLINYSYIRFQLTPVLEVAKTVPVNFRVTNYHPFSLMEGYSQLVKDVVDRVKSNTNLRMLEFKSYLNKNG
jgi:hypothetical protein